MIERVGLQNNFDFKVIQVIGEDAESELVVQRHTMAIYRAKKQIRRQDSNTEESSLTVFVIFSTLTLSLNYFVQPGFTLRIKTL